MGVVDRPWVSSIGRFISKAAKAKRAAMVFVREAVANQPHSPEGASRPTVTSSSIRLRRRLKTIIPAVAADTFSTKSELTRILTTLAKRGVGRGIRRDTGNQGAPKAESQCRSRSNCRGPDATRRICVWAAGLLPFPQLAEPADGPRPGRSRASCRYRRPKGARGPDQTTIINHIAKIR